MKLGLWEDAIAHKTLINTKLHIIAQERKSEPTTYKASNLAHSITQTNVHLKNWEENPQHITPT